jgi:hypothetical protein
MDTNAFVAAEKVSDADHQNFAFRSHEDLESVYKCAFSVMPDLIRHPEGFESTGFRLSPE